MRSYLDSSAAAKLLAEEAESAALAQYLDDQSENDELIASALVETELRRFASCTGIEQSAVTQVLLRVSLIEPGRGLFAEAGLLPGTTLRSLDALHLATALRLECDELIGYDLRLLAAADGLGLVTISPHERPTAEP